MILIAGGTGVLGSAIARRLLEAGRRVTVLTRDTRRATDLRALGAEAVAADLRHGGSLRGACEGVTHVITTANAFGGSGDNSVTAVDLQGTRNLIDAARDARVRQFIFTSALLPDAYESIDYFAAKRENEEYLKRSGLTWTILRPTAFMETWAAMIGDELVKDGTIRIFGAGRNPINFVAVDDVAAVAAMTVDCADALNAYVDIGGPENLTLLEVADTFERVTGRNGARKNLPLAMMRVMAPFVRLFDPIFARKIRAGILSATIPQPFDPAPMLARYPITLTRLEDWVWARYGARK
jgi:NADH dehydrogenase